MVSKDHRSSGSSGSKKLVPHSNTLGQSVSTQAPSSTCPCSQHTRHKVAMLTSFCFCVKPAPPASQKMVLNCRILHSPLPPSEVGSGQ